MKLRLPLLAIFTLCSVLLTFSQENKLVGQWKLDAIELKDFSSEDLVFTPEESFFGNYLNSNEALNIELDKFPVVVGGDMVLYDYTLEGSKLKLSFSNTVVRLKDGKQEEFTKEGESEFKLKVSPNKLIISRRNETFFESYTFSKLN